MVGPLGGIASRRLITVAASLVLAFSSGCAILNGFIDPTKVGQFGLPGRENVVGIRRVLSVREGTTDIPNATDPEAADLVPDFTDYRIQPGDVLFVSVADLIAPGQQQTEQQQVSGSGYVRIPVLGAMQVTGLTEREFEDELKSQLIDGDILPDPQVRVIVTSAQTRVFYILGTVGATGPYPIRSPNMRLLEAIVTARGIGPSVKELYVIRPSRPDGDTPLDAAAPTAGDDGGLVIPPPNDEIDGYTSFSSSEGLGQDTQPVRGTKATGQGRTKLKPGEDPQIKDLMEALAPGNRAAQRSGEGGEVAERPGGAKKISERPFAPLIYDPETGQAMEARPLEPEAIQPEENGADAPTRTIEDGPPGETEEFKWSDLQQEQQSTQRIIKIDVSALKKGDPRQNIVVRNRDIIRVPVDTGAYYMMGEINRPGVYGLGGREITIKQAVASAGGFGPLAFPMRCEIIRRVKGTDEQITIAINLDAIFAGLEDDVLLKDDDIVNVGTHFIAPFLFVIRNSFRFTYGFGFVYDRNFADQDAIAGKQNPETIRRIRRQQQGLPF